jgi:hypothetical protein
MIISQWPYSRTLKQCWKTIKKTTKSNEKPKENDKA